MSGPDIRHSTPDIRHVLRLAALAYWLTLFVATHWPRLKIEVDGRDLGEMQIDKLVHFGAFAVLGLLFIAAQWGGGRFVLVGTLLAGGYALLDEGSQMLPVLERTASWVDLGSNLAGVFAAWCGAAVLRWNVMRGKPVGVSVCRALIAAGLPSVLFVGFLPGLWLAPVLPVPKGPMDFVLDWRWDWAGHFVIAGAGVWLLAGAEPLGKRRGWANRIAALAMVGLSAPLIELAQSYTRRGNEWTDQAAHYLGMLAAMIVAGGYLMASTHATKHATDQKPAPSPQPSPPGIGRGSKASFVSGARTVSLLTLLSRVTGLLRESVLAGAFGRGPVADAFVFGFQVPNLFRRLFGEGALSAALIPVYAELLHRDRVTAQRLAWACVAALTALLGAITLVSEAALAALLLARDRDPNTALAIRLTMVMLPYMPLVCLVAILGAVLQVHGRFASTAAAPIVLNLVVVAVALLFAVGEADATRAVYFVSLAVLIAGAGQLLWQLAAVARVEPIVGRFEGTAGSMRTLLKRFVPTAIGLGIFQINTFLDNVMALGLRDTGEVIWFGFRGPLEQGDVAGLAWAQRLYEFPLGIFGIAIATAIFPALARAAAGRGGSSQPHRAQDSPARNEFDEILRHGLRLTVFIGLPASVGLLLLGLPVVRVLFERGAFTVRDSEVVAFVLGGYAPAIWAYSMNHVLTRGFYALGDTRTPLHLSTAMVFLNLLLNLTLVWFLGPAGFAWSTAACAVLQCVLMIAVMGRYIQWPVDAGVTWSWVRSVLLSGALAVVLLWATSGLNPATMTHRELLAMLAWAVPLGGAVVFAGAWVLRMPEVGWLLRRG